MNQNDDKNKKDPDERDPFNFFKLSPEPSNNNNNKDQKNLDYLLSLLLSAYSSRCSLQTNS